MLLATHEITPGPSRSNPPSPIFLSKGDGPDNPSFLTPADLSARWLGVVRERTLTNWRAAGAGPAFVKIGGRILYPLDGVVAWERSRTFEGTGHCDAGDAP